MDQGQQEMTTQDYVNRVPIQNNLDMELDQMNNGVDRHLMQVASAIVDWETNLATFLSLTEVDKYDIKKNNVQDQALQKRATLIKWKGKFGFRATYRALLNACAEAGEVKAAKKIVQLLGGPVIPTYSSIQPPPVASHPQASVPSANTVTDVVPPQPPPSVDSGAAVVKDVEFSKGFSPNQLHSWLLSNFVPQPDCDSIRDKRIPGIVFQRISKEDWKDKHSVVISALGLDIITELQKTIAKGAAATDHSAGTSSNLAPATKTADQDDVDVGPVSLDIFSGGLYQQSSSLASDGPGTKKIVQYEAYKRGDYEPRLRLDEDENVITKVDSGTIKQLSQELGYYSMSSTIHGVALIINNKDFFSGGKKSKTYGQRDGSDRDEYNFTQTSLFLGYRPIVFRNLKKDEILELFKTLDNFLDKSNAQASHKVTNHDSLICCILSHGDEGVIISSDCKIVEIKAIEKLAGKSQKLMSKPKIFFVQACQGLSYGPAPIASDGTTTSERANIYICFAAAAGDKAFRNLVKGSWFITEVCKILCEKAKRYSLHSDFQLLLNKKVAKNPLYRFVDKDGNEHVQQPSCFNQLEKHVHFFFEPEM